MTEDNFSTDFFFEQLDSNEPEENLDDDVKENDILDYEESEIKNIETKSRENINKITIPKMTIYEKSVVVANRTHQIENGYLSNLNKDFLKDNNITSSYDIALEEFKQDKLPSYVIKREFPNGTYEIWKHSDFKFFPK